MEHKNRETTITNVVADIVNQNRDNINDTSKYKLFLEEYFRSIYDDNIDKMITKHISSTLATWDSYALSILFISVIWSFPRNTFSDTFVMNIFKRIHPNPKFRL